MIIWDKNFIKTEVAPEEPLGAPFSMEEDFETVSLPEPISATVEIEDTPEVRWTGIGFGGK